MSTSDQRRRLRDLRRAGFRVTKTGRVHWKIERVACRGALSLRHRRRRTGGRAGTCGARCAGCSASRCSNNQFGRTAGHPGRKLSCEQLTTPTRSGR